MEKWWKDYPWRQVQTNLREIDMLDIDADEYVRQMQAFDATVAMINVGGIIASYPTDLPFHFQSPYLKGDSLKKIIDSLHAAGIKVVARTDFSKIRRPIYEQHPDWAYRRADGGIVDYNGDVHACINGGYQQEAAFLILREINEKLQIDGLFINMGGFQTRDYSYNEHGLCHCENCRVKFQAMFGMQLPRAVDMQDPAYRKYRAFQRQVIKEYRQKLTDFCREINPQIAINEVDFFRMESNTEYRRPLPFWQYSASSNSRTLRGTQQEVVVSNTSVDFIGFPYRHVAVSPAQQGLRMWQNLANLGNLDYYLIGRLDNHRDKSGYEPVKKAFHFHKQHEADFAHLHSVAHALLIRSQHWGGSGEEIGWIRALTEKHILFDEALESEALTGNWDNYQAIILPGTSVVSDEMASRLDDFAHQGGCVIGTGLFGQYDGMFEPRKDFPLACIGVEKVLHNSREAISAYLELRADEKAAFPSFDKTDLLFIGDQYTYCRYGTAVKRYAHLLPPQHFGPPERCYTNLSTDFPGIVVNAHGKGKGIYIPWLPGELYAREGYDNSFWLMADVLCRHAGLIPVANDLSPMVEVTLGVAQAGSHALVQLVNGTGHFGTSYFQPVRVNGIGLSIPCTRPVKKMVNLVSSEKIPFTQVDGRVCFTLDHLDEYGCIKLLF